MLNHCYDKPKANANYRERKIAREKECGTDHDLELRKAHLLGLGAVHKPRRMRL